MKRLYSVISATKSHPTRTGLTHLPELTARAHPPGGLYKLRSIIIPVRQVIRVKSIFPQWQVDKRHPLCQRCNRLLRVFSIRCPGFHVFFRPEEVDVTSQEGVRHCCPLTNWQRNMPDKGCRFRKNELAVFDADGQFVATV